MEICGGKMKTIINKNAKGYGYKYTDLAEIHNYLDSINSRYIQKVERIEGDDYIFTKRSFDNKWEEEWIQGSRVVQATLTGIKNPAQEQGSALTYARRYSLLMAYGLATDDDDAASLTTKNNSTDKKIEQMQNILKLIDETGVDLEVIKTKYEIDSLNKANDKQLNEIEDTLKKHKKLLKEVNDANK